MKRSIESYEGILDEDDVEYRSGYAIWGNSEKRDIYDINFIEDILSGFRGKTIRLTIEVIK